MDAEFHPELSPDHGDQWIKSGWLGVIGGCVQVEKAWPGTSTYGLTTGKKLQDFKQASTFLILMFEVDTGSSSQLNNHTGPVWGRGQQLLFFFQADLFSDYLTGCIFHFKQ